MDRTPWVGEHRGLRSSIPVWLELCFEETLVALSRELAPWGMRLEAKSQLEPGHRYMGLREKGGTEPRAWCVGRGSREA